MFFFRNKVEKPQALLAALFCSASSRQVVFESPTIDVFPYNTQLFPNTSPSNTLLNIRC